MKRFLHEADLHLPFLLRLATGAIDVCAETAEATNAAGEEEMDVSDDEFEPTDAEVAAEASHVPLLSSNSSVWDSFLGWCCSIENPWLEDTLDYRKLRALEYCNGAREVSRAQALSMR